MEFKPANLFPENWLNAFGSTLFHSLWLGIVLAVCCGLVVFATRKTNARIRYNLLTGCLFLFATATIIVFYFALNEESASLKSVIASQSGIEISHAYQNQEIIRLSSHSFYDGITKIITFWSAYSFEIVSVWFLVICAKCLQLALGLKTVYQLKTSEIYAAGKKWDERLALLSVKIGLDQQVKLMQSGMAKVPMVIGHCKPLILIPLGLLNGLSTAEVDAILAHELAHVKRKDYVVNLLQHFIEIIFFFNPAVLWVSQLIKTERENCCDDLAIACVNDRKNYVKALIFCQEFKQCAPAFAMGINGGKSSLLNRVSRMLFNTNSTLNKMEKTILTIALVSTVIGSLFFKNVSKAATKTKETTSVLILQDTAKKVQSSKANAKTADELEKEIEHKMKIAEKKLIEKKQKTDSSKQKQHAAEDARYNKEQKRWSEEEAKFALEDRKWAEEDKKWAENDRKQAEQEIGEKMPKAPRAPRLPRTPRAPRPVMPPMPPAPPVENGINLPNPPKFNGNFVVTGQVNEGLSTGKVKNKSDKISADLLKDGIISDIKNVSYQLDNKQLIVNEVKQDQNIHTRYKEKFLNSANQLLRYVKIDRVEKN